jgi:uncharacterized protein
MQQQVEFENHGQKISGILHMPSNPNPPIVIFSHGFTGNKDRPLLVTVANALEEAGYAVLRFDYRGSGRSIGKFEDMSVGGMIEDLQKAIDVVSRMETVDTTKIGVLGHSLGASMIILTTDPRIKAAVLIAPCVYMKKSFSRIFDRYSEKGWETDFFRQGWIYLNKHNGYKVTNEFWSQVKMMDMTRDIQDLRVSKLIIGATGDQNVDLKELRDLFYSASEPKEKVELPGNHSFPGIEHTTVPSIIKWLNVNLKI